MIHLKKFEGINPRIGAKKSHPFQILARYEHGDADLTTYEKFNFKDKESFDNALKFFYECMNFEPKTAYGKLGYFNPLPDMVNAGAKENVIVKKLEEISNKYGLDYNEYILSDSHYNQGFAGLDGVKAKIDGNDKVVVFMDALETNRIILPNVGDIIKVDPNHINGYGKDLFGGKSIDYMPNSGPKDFLVKNFDAKVIDCSIHFHHDYDNKYYISYTHLHYVFLLESIDNVLKDNIPHYGGNKPLKLTTEMNGWDPEFESKFDKEKYDGMNYYEVKI